MAFSDPQTITIAGVATPLPRISSGENSGSFRSSDGLVKLTVSSQYGKRNRHTVRVDHSKVAADPFNTGLNDTFSMSAYVVFDVPPVGYTLAQATDIANALLAYLTASSSAAVTKSLGGEN